MSIYKVFPHFLSICHIHLCTHLFGFSCQYYIVCECLFMFNMQRPYLPKGRALMNMYRVVSQTKRGNYTSIKMLKTWFEKGF